MKTVKGSNLMCLRLLPITTTLSEYCYKCTANACNTREGPSVSWRRQNHKVSSIQHLEFTTDSVLHGAKQPDACSLEAICEYNRAGGTVSLRACLLPDLCGKAHFACIQFTVKKVLMAKDNLAVTLSRHCPSNSLDSGLDAHKVHRLVPHKPSPSWAGKAS